MRNISKESFVAANVLMKFEYGSVSFCIPEGATLADISEKYGQGWQVARG